MELATVPGNTRSAAVTNQERPPITVMSWWDVYPLTDTTQVECPDCEQLSPPADNLYALVVWVTTHGRECPA